MARLAIRSEILADPGSLGAYAQQVGKTFYFEVVGSTFGSIWGDGIYTSDSALAKAAVHAGGNRSHPGWAIPGGQVHVFGQRVWVWLSFTAEKWTRPRPVNGYTRAYSRMVKRESSG